MARRSIEERRAQLQAKLQQLEQKERDQQRTDDTRMRIVLGGALLAELRDQVERHDPGVADGIAQIRDLVIQRVTRPADARARQMLLDRLSDIEAALNSKDQNRQSSILPS